MYTWHSSRRNLIIHPQMKKVFAMKFCVYVWEEDTKSYVVYCKVYAKPGKNTSKTFCRSSTYSTLLRDFHCWKHVFNAAYQGKLPSRWRFLALSGVSPKSKSCFSLLYAGDVGASCLRTGDQYCCATFAVRVNSTILYSSKCPAVILYVSCWAPVLNKFTFAYE